MHHLLLWHLLQPVPVWMPMHRKQLIPAHTLIRSTTQTF
nr:MAG TPA: hypothetical protein [Caudoviricetes sp.]